MQSAPPLALSREVTSSFTLHTHLYQAGGLQEDKTVASPGPQTPNPGWGRAPVVSSAPKDPQAVPCPPSD